MSDLIITDENWRDHCNPTDIRCGMVARDFDMVPYGSIAGVPEAVDIPIVPMEDWPDAIADKERTRSTLKHIWASTKIGVLQQSNVSYCHAFSGVMGAMVYRELMGLEYVELSASSVGGPVTNWRNAGAYIHDDLKQMIIGIASTEFVPMLTTNKKDCKPGWEADAKKYRVTEWKDVKSRDILVHGSLLLANNPVLVGLNYWGHAVFDGVLKDMDKSKRATDWTRYGVEFLNSWGTAYGTGGWAIRTGNKMLADAIYTIFQVAA